MGLKNEFNRVATDNSQLQKFTDEVCDALDNGQGQMASFSNGAKIESLVGFAFRREDNYEQYSENIGVDLKKWSQFIVINGDLEISDIKIHIDDFNGLIIFTSTMRFWFIPAYHLNEGGTYDIVGADSSHVLQFRKMHLNFEQELEYDGVLKVNADVVAIRPNISDEGEYAQLGGGYGIVTGIRLQPVDTMYGFGWFSFPQPEEENNGEE